MPLLARGTHTAFSLSPSTFHVHVDLELIHVALQFHTPYRHVKDRALHGKDPTAILVSRGKVSLLHVGIYYTFTTS